MSPINCFLLVISLSYPWLRSCSSLGQMSFPSKVLGTAGLALIILTTVGCDPRYPNGQARNTSSTSETTMPAKYLGPSPAWNSLFSLDADLLAQTSNLATSVPNIDLCDHRARLASVRDSEIYGHVFPTATEHHRLDADTRDEFLFQLDGLSNDLVDHIPGLEDVRTLRLQIRSLPTSDGTRDVILEFQDEGGSPISYPADLLFELQERCP